MDINYERIFDIVINLADAPQEIKAFCIREQKKADRDYFYKEDDFYKGLLKVVADKKQLAKYQLPPMPTRIGSLFIAGGGGSGYNYESIEVVEQIINEICKEDKMPHTPYILEHQLKVNEKKQMKNKERFINSEELSLFFKSHFKEKKPINYFHRLVEELKTDRTDKEFGEIALMIHNSDHINDRVPQVFNKWLIIFSNCINIKNLSYNKGKLNNPSHNLRQLFNYL